MQGAEPGDVAILPLPGRVIHEGDQTQRRLLHQGLEQLEHVRIGELQAQMQEMIGLERLRRAGPAQHVDRQAEIFQPLALAAVIPDADGIAAIGDVADAVRASTHALQATPAQVPLYTALAGSVAALRDALPEATLPFISAADAEREAAEEAERIAPECSIHANIEIV